MNDSYSRSKVVQPLNDVVLNTFFLIVLDKYHFEDGLPKFVL